MRGWQQSHLCRLEGNGRPPRCTTSATALQNPQRRARRRRRAMAAVRRSAGPVAGGPLTLHQHPVIALRAAAASSRADFCTARLSLCVAALLWSSLAPRGTLGAENAQGIRSSRQSSMPERNPLLPVGGVYRIWSTPSLRRRSLSKFCVWAPAKPALY